MSAFAQAMHGPLYLFAKAMHVVGFISWFAGLFYIVRLFIYHVESTEKPEPDRSVLHAQFVIMERRLWKAITIPAMVVTVLFGSYLAVVYLGAVRNTVQSTTWLFVKFALLAGLLTYHGICGAIRDQLAEGQCRWTSARLRQWNEVATLLMVAIVMLAVFKSMFNAVWGTVALASFGVLLAVAIKLVRLRRAGPR
jgi:protoporphyrinogen IX oxidase